MEDLKIFKQKFDLLLKNYLDEKIESVTTYTKDSSVLEYINYLEKIVLSGGKRIRPYLAYLMYQTLANKDPPAGGEKVLELLVFLEIFHSFCLVHDDIMDKADLRHGTSTSHAYILTKLKKEKRIGDLAHVGISQAILLGDILLTWSQEIINSNNDFSQKILQKVRQYFHEMSQEVFVGQMIDVDITTREKVSKELIDEKTRLKTAGYSFIKPLLIGAALSGKSTKETEEFCREFGLRMGIAFQTQDDLLDIVSSNKNLGKTTSLDKSQNQHTYFTYFPSLEYGKKIIATNFEQARNLIKNSLIWEDAKNRFLELVKIIQNRSS